MNIMDNFIIFCAQYLYIVIVLIGVGFIFQSRKKKELIFIAIASALLSYILAKLLGNIIKSPRPLFSEHIQPLIPTANDNGFPSDHTLLAMTIALFVFAYNKKIGIFLLVLALIVGITRIATHSHHIIDVMGSILICVVSTMTVVLIAKWYNRK